MVKFKFYTIAHSWEEERHGHKIASSFRWAEMVRYQQYYNFLSFSFSQKEKNVGIKWHHRM